MRSSCIEHPANDRRMAMSLWQIIACDGNRCAAALLNYFEFCHNWKIEQALKAQSENDYLELRGDLPINPVSLEQWHTEDELEEALLWLFERKTIRKAIELLVEKEYIRYVTEPRFKPSGMPDRTRRFVFNADAISAWLKEVYPRCDRRRASIRKIRRLEQKNHEDIFLDGQQTKMADGENAQKENLPDGHEVKIPDGEMCNFKANLPSDKKSSLHSTTYCRNSLNKGEEEAETHDAVSEAKQLLREGSALLHPLAKILLRICLIPPNLPMTLNQERSVRACIAWLVAAGATPETLEGFAAWWKADWRGRDGKAPTPNQVREAWPHYAAETQTSTHEADETPQGETPLEVAHGKHFNDAGKTGTQAASGAGDAKRNPDTRSAANARSASGALAKLEARQRERRERENAKHAASAAAENADSAAGE